MKCAKFKLHLCYDKRPSGGVIDNDYLNALSKVGIVCRSALNGARSSNCDMQTKKDIGIEYVKIRSMTNEDGWINLTPINNLGMRQFKLCSVYYKMGFNESRRRQWGMCNSN